MWLSKLENRPRYQERVQLTSELCVCEISQRDVFIREKKKTKSYEIPVSFKGTNEQRDIFFTVRYSQG